jgi:hypothetical protein
MPEGEARRIVYLFGAGGTHAELQNLDPDLIEEQSGLLIGNVSSRVIEKARRDGTYTRGVEMVSATSGLLNIEFSLQVIPSLRVPGMYGYLLWRKAAVLRFGGKPYRTELSLCPRLV